MALRFPEPDYIHLLVVKGNLKHRIEKLGTEISNEKELNEDQKLLRRIAMRQHWYSSKADRPEGWRCFPVLDTSSRIEHSQCHSQEWHLFTIQAYSGVAFCAADS